MIEVIIEESGINFSKSVGEMTPKQIEDFIRIIKEYGTLYNNEKYTYVDSYYDCDNNGYLIVVNIQN
ncbi:hypothetical protein [Heyndrickxia camelliae]|uniref:Uncharacterized protein n=1 Tax=Heyndrickxia camelliae TaxID=1707093 RepID=A0A2N3LCY5_9BACI|nr:hypothetical protein [Heyndrickxia camelliae]PKR82425.1 hypothetical protein CWO92_24590 [Heyndrickxia camelliae]